MGSFSSPPDQGELFDYEDLVVDESVWDEWDAAVSSLPSGRVVDASKHHDAGVVRSSPAETALEYARHIGLARPWDPRHVAGPDDLLLAKTLDGRSLHSKLEETVKASGLPVLSFQPICSFDIRLIATPGAMMLLKQVMCHQTTGEERHRVAIESTDLDLTTAPATDMELELPLLPPGLARRMARRVRQLRFPKLSNVGIPNCDDFDLNFEAEMPEIMKRWHAEVEGRRKADRLDVTKEAMACLARDVRPTPWTHKQQREMMDDLCGYKKYKYSDDVELVLTPPPRPHEPLKLDSETLKICPLELRDLEAADTRKWADMIEEKENDLKLSSPSSLDSFSNIDVSKAARQDTSSSPRGSPGMYLEPPLLRSPHATVHTGFTPELASATPRDFDAPEPMADGRLPHAAGESSPATEELYQVFHEQNTQVTRKIEQDKLHLHAESRLPVPLMNFSVPEPQWAKHSRDARAVLGWMRDSQAEIDWRGPAWPVDREAQNKMRFVPFRMDTESKLPLDIKLEVAPGVLEEYLARKQNDEIETRANHVDQDPSGWAYGRFLDDSEDDDELLPSRLIEENDRSTDLLTLARKRKRQLEDNGEEEDPMGKSGKTGADSTVRSSVAPPGLGGWLCMGEKASATTMLENYMQLNAPKKGKSPTSSPFFSSPRTPTVDGSNLGSAKLAAKNTATVPGAPLTRADEASRAMPPPPRPVPIPVPEIAASLSAPGAPHLQVLAALSLSPGVMACLKKLLPGLSLVDRDYHAFDAAVWQPKSVSRSTIMSPLSHEADITSCPSTGIILTPLVKLRQRAAVGTGPCGGGRSRTPFQYRVERVAARYERLIILVSDSMTTGIGAAGANYTRREHLGCLTPTDAAGLAEFQGFVAALSVGSAATQVVYVGGGDGTLARWAAALIGRHATTEGRDTQRLLRLRETTWELFLRRAGMNAYAAQVVLEVLGVPEKDGMVAVGNRDGSVYGLPRFVTMTPDERAAMFGVMMGGRRVLDRVGKKFEERWD